MKKLIDDLDKIPDFLTDGIRGVLLLKRNKDGQEGNVQRKGIKRISRCTDEWKDIVRELQLLKETSHKEHRIYASLNIRDMTKAIQEFKRRQLENDFGNLYELQNFYWDIKNRFFSCLMVLSL